MANKRDIVKEQENKKKQQRKQPQKNKQTHDKSQDSKRTRDSKQDKEQKKQFDLRTSEGVSKYCPLPLSSYPNSMLCSGCTHACVHCFNHAYHLRQ
ncbi:MAG: hypothetical protein LBL91_03825 [Lachnospiraceae bacterium]|jgi:hypothetical protein|nr:hypothetical protein [Lachnospiraceae bacterium]